MAAPRKTIPSWRAFEDNEITHSGAHYLLAIAAASKEGPAPHAAAVARTLGVSRAAASLQLRALVVHGLVRFDEAQGLHLTRLGADLVTRVRNKREVVRVFLSDILGVRPATAEADACKIEHLLSEETGAATVRLIRFLHSGHPAARACLAAFRATTAACPPGRLCDLCVASCLLADAQRDESAPRVPARGRAGLRRRPRVQPEVRR
jgi:DtxR family transcriptional regulator, Mn-dependent transcriptional regulator